MNQAEEKKELVRYRLQQARESLEEAHYLKTGDKTGRSIINRAYYAMFYAILAMLIFEPYSSSKHSGVISYFNRVFIKKGVFPKDMGRWVSKLFELRQRGDYREFYNVSEDESEQALEHAGRFIENIAIHLKERHDV